MRDRWRRTAQNWRCPQGIVRYVPSYRPSVILLLRLLECDSGVH